MSARPPLAILMPSLTGGGAERILLRLAEGFAQRGHAVDLLLTRVKGTHGDQIPTMLRPLRLAPNSSLRGRVLAAAAAGTDWPALVAPAMLPVKASWALRYLADLTRYLRERRPVAMLSANSWPNLVALWARRRAGVPTRIVVSERVQLSERVRHLGGHWRWRHLPRLIGATYQEADAVVAVSRGVARDLEATAGLASGSVITILNPVVTAELFAQAAAPCPHPWLADDGPPVVLGAGRLHPQKDFPTLLGAFARLRSERPARLIILGEGPERARLEALARTLGVTDAVSLPGFDPNPYAYMARAAAFALSSTYEGLPGVLIQALACGCPAASTDCPSGPSEVLDGGRFGPLVPVGDDAALAIALTHLLDRPPDRDMLRRRGLDFAADAAIDRYLAIMLGRSA